MTSPDTKKDLLKTWGPFGAILLLIAAAWMTGVHRYISLESFHAHKTALAAYVDQHGFVSAVLFIAAYVASVALSLPVATLLTLAGGFFFGKWLGTLYVVTAATIGAILVFLIARSALGETLRARAGDTYIKMEKNMKENAVGYLLFLRLVPAFPFFLVNIVPALFNIPLRVFAATTCIGILPGSFVYVNLGETLGEIQTLNDLVSFETLLAFILLGILALLPTLHRQWRIRKGLAALAVMAIVMQPLAVRAGGDYAGFLALYDGLLAAHVQPSEKTGIAYHGVDYSAWAKDPRHEKAMAALQSAPVLSSSDYWINVYNILTIDLIIKTGENRSIRNLGSVFQPVWKKYTWIIDGKSYSLHAIEHDILRPRGDPRIHFAINCASVSCPDLRREAYRAKNFETQLDDQVRKTLGNKHKGLAQTETSLRLSRIFDWFAKDFDQGDVQGWLSSYIDLDRQYKISYLDYDWSLNGLEKTDDK